MKFASYISAGHVHPALVVGEAGRERVVDITKGAQSLPVQSPLVEMRSLREIIAGGETLAESLRQIEKRAASGELAGTPLSEVKLAPPLPDPPKLLCVAGNYADHYREGGQRPPSASGKYSPRFFMKPPSTTLIASGDPIVIPKVAQKIDWEGELAVVIGRGGKDIPEDRALSHVFGYSILNDISERELDPGPRTEERDGDWFFDWLAGKWFDTSAPFGPVIVTSDAVGDPHDLRLTLAVNDEVMQDANTDLMIFDVPVLISWISQYLTLEPGDVIATGTPAGVGSAKGIFLKPGDTVTCKVQGIGTLVNPVS